MLSFYIHHLHRHQHLIIAFTTTTTTTNTTNTVSTPLFLGTNSRSLTCRYTKRRSLMCCALITMPRHHTRCARIQTMACKIFFDFFFDFFYPCCHDCGLAMPQLQCLNCRDVHVFVMSLFPFFPFVVRNTSTLHVLVRGTSSLFASDKFFNLLCVAPSSAIPDLVCSQR